MATQTQDLTAKTKQEVKDAEQTRPGRFFVPDVDIAEDERGLRLWVDMPGVDKDRVSVDLHDDVLTISGEVDPKAYEGLTPVYIEYNVGPFRRRFTLADGGRYDREKIAARIADGVLELTLPTAERAKPRRIDVATG
jgi:HSP20 family molecular chaperone IbpA